MHIHELFERSINRRIEPVVFVGATDEDLLKTEIEEFVITHEIGNRIETLLEIYTQRQRTPSIGVWLSGYFGSGKSHLLKMLAFMLENRQFEHHSTIDIFAGKLQSDPMLRGKILQVKNIPSESILFNIDQLAEQDTATRVDSVLSVFMKVFNNHCGYYGNQGYVAQFERDLDNEGIYDAFKQAYAAIANRAWEEGRKSVILQRPNIDKAYAQARQIPVGEVNNIIAQYQASYAVSVDSFAELVKQYIDKHPDRNFRLNFFVDEVGQFIASRVELMLNLQSISETIGEKCGGRSWIMVTSQSDLPALANQLTSQNTNRQQDFSRIQARFMTKLNLTSASVDEVLQKRLLSKTTSAKETLLGLHNEQYNNYPTLFSFGLDSGKFSKPFTSEQQFIDYYPFVPYQFLLFQQSIITLSGQGAFTGAYASIGARSLLSSTQHAVIKYGYHLVGDIVPFDAFYDGISASLREIFINGIVVANQQLNNAMALRVLKALFLIKYVQGIEGTLANLRVLLYDSFSTPMQQFERAIKEALLILEQQAYIQRDGEIYNYLTDEEKDIEEQIRQIAVDQSDIAKEIDRFVFNRVLDLNKFRMAEYGQDFPITRFIDGHPPMNQTFELSVHVITPLHQYNDIATIRSHTADLPRLTIVLPDTLPFIDEIRTYKQTEQFVRTFNTSATKDSTRALVDLRGAQNHNREKAIIQMIKDLLGSATYICNMSDIAVGNGDYNSKFTNAMHATIRQVYPSRMMVTKTYDASTVTSIVTRPVRDLDDTLMGTEQDILNTINRWHRGAQSVTLKKILDVYSVRPYGWPLFAILAFLGNLYRLGKIEMRYNASIIDKTHFASITSNANASQSISIVPQVELTPAQIQGIRTFFSRMFGETFALQSANQISDLLKQRLQTLATDLSHLEAQRTHYPFVASISPFIEQCQELFNHPPQWYFTEFTSAQRDEFIEQYESTVVPIREFMTSERKTKYDELAALAADIYGNASATDINKLNELRDALARPDIHQRLQTIIPLKTELERAIESHLAAARTNAINYINERFGRLIEGDQRWTQHSSDRQAHIIARRDTIITQIQSTQGIARIKQLADEFVDAQIIQILNTDMVLPPPSSPAIEPVPDQTVTTTIEPHIAVPAQPTYVSYKNLPKPDGMGSITNQAELERFLQAQRTILEKELAEGKHILL